MFFDILRKKIDSGSAYHQRFEYQPKDDNDTVATALRMLNLRHPLKDVYGNDALKIRWECNCLQKKCGACSMVINGIPRLACDVRIKDEGDVIKIEPLKKFPVVEDLIVDRKTLFSNLKNIRLWFNDPANVYEDGPGPQYDASRCLQCGLCLEVCPNFCAGDSFYGMAAAIPMTRILTMLPESQKKEAAKLYSKHIFEGCGKSLACRKICPAGIDIENMLVNSNAIAVWKRYSKRFI